MTTTLESLKSCSDSSLVEACLAGDQDAWREVVSRYSRLVLSIPVHHGLCDDDAHDVFQSVFVALVNRLPALRDRTSLAKWLITTSHRTTWRHLQRRRRSAPPDEHLIAPVDAPPETVLRWERQHLVRQALRTLGGMPERLLAALYLEQPRASYDEISRRLEIPRGSIGPMRTRCLGRLLALLRKDLLSDEPTPK